MKYEFLNGQDLKRDLINIRDTLEKDSDVVFVYKSRTSERPLDAYIGKISDKDLAAEVGIKPNKLKALIYKLKICNERTNLDITYQIESKNLGRVTSVSQLLEILNSTVKTRLVFNSNLREDLAFVLQQLIYVGYPVGLLDVMLKKEEKDAEKSQRFMDNIDKLSAACSDAQIELEHLLTNSASDNNDILNDLTETFDSCKKIREQIEDAKKIEMEIEVAASKKTGKSVIVNSMIGDQLAPTSLTQATPNTCIYKKSSDNKYYLQSVRFEDSQNKIVPTSEKLEFADKESIFKKINDEFRKAEQNSANSFAIDDMEISYVTNQNNFQSYTIYDTPGPDAAGTSHSKSAEYALQHSKVALFALDYTKYLTNDEFNYLNTVKAHFDKNNKFHSLVFALNKTDMRYTDGGDPKSVIRDTEFIRNRLINIDRKYGECIIFPTSALVYFNTLIAEHADIPELLNSEKLEDEFQKIAREYVGEVEELVSLMNYVNNLSWLSGVSKISLETLKQDSGMPALLNYISYIAKSKAREEIVNSITCNIDAQRNKIKAILDHVGNIEKVIKEDNETIMKIAEVIFEYKAETERINKTNFTEADLQTVDNKLFKAYQRRCEQEKRELSFTSITDMIKADMYSGIKKADIIADVYRKLSKKLWEKIEKVSTLETGTDINYLISSKVLPEIISERFKKIFEDLERYSIKNINTVRDASLEILKGRDERLQSATQRCKEKLDKMNCDLELPEDRNFDVDLPKPTADFDFSEKKMNLPLDFLLQNSSIFEKRFSIINLFRKLMGRSEKEFQYRKVSMTESQFYDELIESGFDRVVRDFLSTDVKLGEYIDEVLEEFDKYVKASVAEISSNFEQLTKASSQSVERFKSLADDRTKYHDNIEELNQRRENIDRINSITAAFMNEWDSVVNG